MLVLLVLHLKDSALWVALVSVMRWSPMLLFGMLGGHLADRVSRWHTLMVTRGANILTTSVLMTLVITDSLEPWHLLIGAFALGSTFAIDMPARYSFIYDMVGARNLVRATSLDMVAMTFGLILGPLAAGLFIELVGFSSAYMFLLTSYVLAFIAVALIRSRITKSTPHSQPIWRSLTTGVRYALENRTILGVLAVTLVFNLTVFSSIQFYAVVAKDHLNVGPALTGVLGAADGMGVLIGSTIIAIVGTVQYHGRFFVMGSALKLVGLLLFVLSPWYLLSFFILLLSGLALTGFITMQSTITLMAAEPEKRGLAMGMVGLCIGIGPIGALQVGGLATALDAQWAIGISAVIGLLLLIPIMLFTPLMRRPIAPASRGAQHPEDGATPSPIQVDAGEATKQGGLP